MLETKLKTGLLRIKKIQTIGKKLAIKMRLILRKKSTTKYMTLEKENGI